MASAAPADGIRPRHFQKLVERMRGTPEEKPIAFLMLRTMQKARYDPSNLGHFGLAADSYTHFTSPIRRYPDLIVHRTLRESRHGFMNEERKAELIEDLPDIARHTSERERRADDAERELVQWKKVRFMADKVGDEFEGYITGVTAFGLYIELIEHFVEGLVHVSTMADDYYRFVERAHILRGENLGKVYRLGDRVKVQVVKVDMERRQVDLGLTEILDAVRESERNRGPRRSKAEPKRERQARKGNGGTQEAAAARQERAGRAQASGLIMSDSIVIGTAGHIDHGKSSLVRALTGTDPDRLKEEKARGITIDLGFAHLVSGGTNFAFVDVPGHERFVKNMLAGAGGIDLVMMVVAADESVMPQTREHFQICRLLKVPAGLIVLTKIDIAGPEMTEIAALEAKELARGSFLQDAPIVAVSSKTGEGLDMLTTTLRVLAEGVRRKSADGMVRLPIDRVFTMKGFGTVVTGTLLSGTLREEQDLVVLPRGGRVKVRGLQVHGHRENHAEAGRRVAANLGGVEVTDLERGDTLCEPDARVADTSSRRHDRLAGRCTAVEAWRAGEVPSGDERTARAGSARRGTRHDGFSFGADARRVGLRAESASNRPPS